MGKISVIEIAKRFIEKRMTKMRMLQKQK